MIGCNRLEARRGIDANRPASSDDAFPADSAAICRAAGATGATSTHVAMSAPEAAPAMLNAGCHAILVKPFPPYVLAARLGRLTRDRMERLRRRGRGDRDAAAQESGGRIARGRTSCAPDAVH